MPFYGRILLFGEELKIYRLLKAGVFVSIQKTSYQLVDYVLAKDVLSGLGVLLIAAGTTLQAHDITLLLEHRIEEIEIVDQISDQISHQMREILGRDELSDRYLHNLTKTKRLFTRVAEGDLPHFNEFAESYKNLSEINLKQSYFFLQLNKIKGHDEYTFRHSINVSIIASIIGKLIGLSKEECDLLGIIGLLHDIGKMKIPKDILLKPGRLTHEEYEIMKEHTIYGYNLLKQMEGSNELIHLGALYHHEKLDGSGYPDGLSGDEIPLAVQIITIADIFDAISTDRVYKQKDSSFLAGMELMNEVYDGRLNANLVLPFVYYLVEGFVGGTAILDNGDQGEVMLIHVDEPHRPLLRIREQYIDLRKERHLQIVDMIAN